MAFDTHRATSTPFDFVLGTEPCTEAHARVLLDYITEHNGWISANGHPSMRAEARDEVLARAPATVRADVTARRRRRALASAVTGDWPVVG